MNLRRSGAALALCGIAACGGGERPPNVVLVVLDTVRADHLSCYGYELPTTPAIDALAEVSDRYATCRATAPWTLPSHASMLTGLYPFDHGAQARRDPETGDIIDALPLRPERLTLAEALSDEGFQTGAVVANRGYLQVKHGVAQGFEHYDEKPRGAPRRGPEVNRLAFEWLDARDPDRPFFLFLNYMDAHRPYNVAPLPPERAASLPPPDPENPLQLMPKFLRAVLIEEDPPSPELVRRVVSQYDTGIAHLDLAIDELVGGLKERGSWESTLFVLTSDHGEYFGEHDLAEHSKDVYEEGLAVPLIVKRPGQSAGRVIDERVSIAEIPALVSGVMPARVGARLRDSFPPPSRERTWAELRYTRPPDLARRYSVRFLRERTVVYAGPYKLIRSTDGHHELYDLERDPREQENLFDTDDERSRALLAEADAMRARADGAEVELRGVERSADELEELRALGYAGDG